MSKLQLFLISACISTTCLSQLPAPSSNYQRTSSYEEVIQVIQSVTQELPFIFTDTLATSSDGKWIPFMVISDQLIKSPQKMHELNRPIICVLANIHGGEVEGKEAILQWLIELKNGQHKELLKHISIIFIPIFNADGNDKIKWTNRINQNGPKHGVGERSTSLGFDLNRDYMKIDAPEMEGLIDLFNQWNPHVFMDLHTTNGTAHGYHLTWSTPLNPNTDPTIDQFQYDVMMPEITQQMERKGWRIFPYGNIYPINNVRAWYTFSHEPRFGTNYYGLRNRMTLLSEAYSYLNFEDRIKVTYDFMSESFLFLKNNASNIIYLTNEIDSKYSDSHPQKQLGIRFEYNTGIEKKILLSPVDTVIHENGMKTYQMTQKIDTISILIRDKFVSKENRQVPFGYVIHPELSEKVAKLLTKQGVSFFTIADTQDIISSELKMESIKWANRTFEKHTTVLISGQYVEKKESLNGWLFVPVKGQLANLIFYLLEPESDDGFVQWNVFDEILIKGTDEMFPVRKINEKLDSKIKLNVGFTPSADHRVIRE